MYKRLCLLADYNWETRFAWHSSFIFWDKTNWAANLVLFIIIIILLISFHSFHVEQSRVVIIEIWALHQKVDKDNVF